MIIDAIHSLKKEEYSTYPIALIRWLDRQLSCLKLHDAMKIVHLQHHSENEKQTLGVLTVDLGGELFVAKTLELGWHDNKSNISRIPAGRYLTRWTRSTRLSNESLNRWLLKNPGKLTMDAPDEIKNVYTYEVTGVPGRAGIRIHSANYFHQLRGCIALGSALKDINADGQLDVVHSGNTVDNFNKAMNHEDFWLDIAA